jgi:hypothetical protein
MENKIFIINQIIAQNPDPIFQQLPLVISREYFVSRKRPMGADALNYAEHITFDRNILDSAR